MVKNMGSKDLNAIKEWIHPDYIFVADFEMITKDDWLNTTEKIFVTAQPHSTKMLNVY